MSEHSGQPADDLNAIEHHYRGIRFNIGPRTPCPGIGWTVHLYEYSGRKVQRQSQGAFYDGCDDHPEGAYAWAMTSCRRFIDKLLDGEQRRSTDDKA